MVSMKICLRARFQDTRISSEIEQKYSEYLEICSVFCSSKFTQNSNLKSLLQWEQHEPRLGEILGSVHRIPVGLI